MEGGPPGRATVPKTIPEEPPIPGSSDLASLTDRPWLTESKKVQKLQDKIYVALQHEIQKKHSAEDKLSKMVSKLPLMKTICNLHLDKLEFFRLLHPETAMNFPPLYKEVFNSELQYSDPRES
ncbi:nuclear receptor ROR-beta-like [Empidonax traillii]|uniref:nuclear receptor ROR-beta-like n=1 Tax=Empidonax traillii TaxID=164674 RepID=UPI000FFD0B4C|nr:nuclear receptor ROR-beta-like [Empidonax traillii]